MDERDRRKLVPKGGKTKVVPVFDGSWKLDGTFTCGPTEDNVARAHRIKSGHWGGAGISASRSLDVAIFFATSGGTCDGYIYVLDDDPTHLANANVTAREYLDAINPEHQEVTLIEASGGSLPESLILRKYEILKTDPGVMRSGLTSCS